MPKNIDDRGQEVKANSDGARPDRFHRAALLVSVLLVAALTLAPYSFSARRFADFVRTGPSAMLWTVLYWSPVDFALNFLLFIPLGLFFSLVRTHRAGRPAVRPDAPGAGAALARSVWLSGAAGCAASACIEFAQLFLDRSCTLTDVFFNGAGAAFGTWIALRHPVIVRRAEGAARGFLRRRSVTLAAGWALAVCAVCAFPLFRNDFRNWKPDDRLWIGNEGGGGGRPWNGDLAGLELYDRVLGASEVRSLHAAGPGRREVPDGRPETAAAWVMDEAAGDTLPPVSGPLRAPRLAGSGLETAAGGGVRVRGERPLQSVDPMDPLIAALAESGALTVCAWIRPDDGAQGGPARIVSCSRDLTRRNFTLGQQGKALHFRVRTPQAGPNGSRLCVKAREALVPGQYQHVAASFRRGFGRICVDGRRLAVQRVPDDVAPHLLGLGYNPASRLAFWALTLVPFGALVSLRARRRRTAAGVLAAVLLYSALRALLSAYLGQPFGF